MKYKTSKCRHFEQSGNCQLGDRCHFAHGDRELRNPSDVSQSQISHKAFHPIYLR